MHCLIHKTFFSLKAGTCGWGGRWTLTPHYSTLWVFWTILIWWWQPKCLDITKTFCFFIFPCSSQAAVGLQSHKEAPPSRGSKLGFFGVKSPRKQRRKSAIYLWWPDEWPQNRRLLSSHCCRWGDEWQWCSLASITCPVPSRCQWLCTVPDRKGFQIWQSP